MPPHQPANNHSVVITTPEAPATTVAPVTTLTAASKPTSPPKPAPAPAPAPPPAPGLTVAQQNAIKTAQSYLRFTNFSRLGLIDQLVFEKFSVEDATFAVDSLSVDYNAQAAGTAQSYLNFTSFSCQGLIDQLVFEKYTLAQATYGATHVGLC